MRTVTVSVKGITAYSPSRFFEAALEKGETHEAHDERRWREHAHADDGGNVFIPGSCFKLALDTAVKQVNEKIKGKGNQTYTRLFEAGVAHFSDMPLGVKVDALQPVAILAHANGMRGPGPRVTRRYPYITPWTGTMEFGVFDDSIPEAKFEEFFTRAGLTAGVGRARPSTGSAAGLGRFEPVEFKWSA